MKLANTTRITRDGLPNAPPGEWFDLLLDKMNSSTEQLTQCLQQNVTIGENMNAAIVEKRFTHGVELSIPVPPGVKGRNLGIRVRQAKAIAGGPRYRVASVDWRFIDHPDPKAAQQLGVTVFFAPPQGLVYLQRSAALNVANTTDYMNWDTNVLMTGDLSHSTTVNPTLITCAKAGILNVSYAIEFGAGPVGFRQTWVDDGSTNTNHSELEVTANRAGIAGSGLVSVVAGQTFRIGTYQDGGGAPLALNVANNRCQMSAIYVAPPIGSKNDVTLVIEGN